MYEVSISTSILDMDLAWMWAKKNCNSYKGQRLVENHGGWRATFVFSFGDEADATMFALKWK